MVLWPEASNNGNCFRREHFYRPIWSWSEGDANKLSFLSACFVYWSNMVSTRTKKLNNSEMKLHFADLKAVYAKLILLFKTSDTLTAKLFRQNKAPKFSCSVSFFLVKMFQISSTFFNLFFRLLSVVRLSERVFWTVNLNLRWCFAIFICFYSVEGV